MRGLNRCQDSALTVCGSVGFEQAEAVVGTLRAVSEAFQHAEIGDVEGRGQQVSHLTHKLGQNDLFESMRQDKWGVNRLVWCYTTKKSLYLLMWRPLQCHSKIGSLQRRVMQRLCRTPEL